MYWCVCPSQINYCFLAFLDHSGQLQPLTFVQYRFDRAEHPIEITKHGNSLKNKGHFKRTKASTIAMLKKGLDKHQPVKVLQEVVNLKGGVVGASSSCDLPRDRRQLYNLKHSTKLKESKHNSGCSLPLKDVLAEVTQMCKDNEGSEHKFIRSIEAAPEPMCVLSTDQQLLDLERFCTKEEFGIISVDPTFNLGSFYVTPITYQNLLVETSSHCHPVLLGPVLIHQTKQFRPFHYFASTLTRLNPNLANIRAFGTDGEPELIKAFKVVLSNAIHLRCANHLRQNIKDFITFVKNASSCRGSTL